VLTVARAEARSAAPPAAVWARLLDGRRWSEWHAGAEWMVLESGLGAADYVTVKPRRGRQTAFRLVRAHEPHEFVLGLRFGPLARLTYAWQLAGAGSGTTIVASVVVDGPFASLVAAPYARKLAAALPESVERLAASA
jgi:hypothetical protein